MAAEWYGGTLRARGPARAWLCDDHGGYHTCRITREETVPAPPSSPVDPAIGHLAGLAEDPPGLLSVLARVAGPRHRRGVRHRLAVILGLAVCAVLAGARSFTAIAGWAADAGQDTLRALGAGAAVPSESTFRRVLQRLDAEAFDELAGQWVQRRTAPRPGGGG
jgi:hypothetical protein